MKKIIKSLILLSVIYFFSSYIYDNWDKIETFKSEINFFYLSFSFLSLLISFFLLPVSFKHIVKLLNYDISLKKISSIFFYSQLAKYLPGGIWGYVGRVYLYKKEGMNTIDATKSVLLETLMIILSGLFIAFLSIRYFKNFHLAYSINHNYLIAFGILIISILLIFLHPKILNFFLKIIPKRFKTTNLSFNYNYINIFKPLLYLIFFWLGVGISFWLLVKSFIHVEPNLLPMFIGIFVISWMIGILAFFAPGGLGIREISIVLLLNLILPTYISAFIAVISRLWWAAGEILCFSISYFWNKTQ